MAAIANAAAAPKRALTGYEKESWEVRGRVVYLLAGTDGRIKIGISKHPSKRIAIVARQAGVQIASILISDIIINAPALEAAFKRAFRPHLIDGEWYSVDIDTARAFVEGEDWEVDRQALATKDQERREAGFRQYQEKLREFFPAGAASR